MSTETIDGIPLTDSLDGGDMNKKARLKALQLAAEHQQMELENKDKIRYEKGKLPRTWVMRMVGSSRGPVFNPGYNNPNRRPCSAVPVVRIREGENPITYASLTQASLATGASMTAISLCLHGKRTQTKDGSKWQWAK